MTPKQVMATEISGLIDFLHTLVTKQPKQIVPLKFAKTYLRIGIILVAKTDKILQTGVGPYVFAMNTSLKADLETVYVLIFDKDWLGEVDREALRQHIPPADLRKLPPDRKRALAERRRYLFAKFGITVESWASGHFSLWDVADEAYPPT